MSPNLFPELVKGLALIIPAGFIEGYNSLDENLF